MFASHDIYFSVRP